MTALALAARFWREATIAILLLAVAALIGYSGRKAEQLRLCQETRLTDQATWRAATQKARAEDLAHARDVEARNAAIQEQAEHDLQAKLAAARAAATAYASRVRDEANSGSQRLSDLPQASKPASGVAGAGEASQLATNDAVACAEAVTKAEGWISWWHQVSTP